MDANTLSIVSSITSILLALFAIGLSIWFFVLTKNSEGKTSNSLTKIETQAQSLERLTGKWMDRFTKYFTDQKPQSPTDALPDLITIVTKISEGFSTSFRQQPNEQQNIATLQSEVVSAYIAIYFYTAVANYYAQGYLPDASQFNPDDESHDLTKRVIDTSATDFKRLEDIIMGLDPKTVAANPLANLLQEAMSKWSTYVRSSSDVFVAKSQQ